MRSMRFRFLAALMIVAPAVAAPVFDTATIKLSGPGRMTPADLLRDGPQLSPVSFTLRNATLKLCVRWAWNVMESQVTGPGWMATERFDIIGKAAQPSSEEEFRQMLQALLIERFHLQFRRETKEQSVYLLQIAKGGPKVKESQTEGEPGIEPDQRKMAVAIKGAKISSLTDLLSKFLFLPVIDQTGLTGKYDVSIDVGKYMPQAGELPDIPGILSIGLQQELGLKLESKKIPLEFLVIEKADRTPTEN